jgi:tRNA nucleotidyltransferase/poly(A) polymerase
MWYGSSMSRIHLADQFIGSLGVEAYRVGGSVRDEIIGKRPKDADYIVRGVR